MEDFDSGANLLSIVNATTVSSDAVVFVESFPYCLSGSENQKPEEVLEKEFSLPEGCGSMLLSDDMMRPCVSADGVEHSILSGTDFPGAEITSSFASPQDSTAIHSLRRLEPSDLTLLSSGAVLPTNVPVLASSDSTGNHDIQDPTFDFELIFMNTPEVSSSPLLENATDLDSLLPPETNMEYISSSGGLPRMPIPQGLQTDSLFLKPESGDQCVSDEGVGLSSQESTVFLSKLSAFTSAIQATGHRFTGHSDHFGLTIPEPSCSQSPVATCVSNGSTGFKPSNVMNGPRNLQTELRGLPLRVCTTWRQWKSFENATGTHLRPQTSTNQGSMQKHKKPAGRKQDEPSLSIAFPNITKASPQKVKEHACGICGISFAARCNLFKHQRAVRKLSFMLLLTGDNGAAQYQFSWITR